MVILEALSLLPGRHRGILHGTSGHGFRAGRGAVPGCCGGHSRHRGQDPALHNIEYEHSLSESERAVNRHFDKEFVKTFFEMSNPDYKLPDDVDFEKWIGDMQKNK